MFIGIDLGGTKIAAAITDNNAKLDQRILRWTEAELGQQKVIDNVFASIDDLLQGQQRSSLKAIGIGIPGRIKDNIILNAPNLSCWVGLNPVQIIQEKYRVPVYAQNDANVAALGEMIYGAGIGKKNFLYMTISTGIGGGIINEGKLLRGYNDLGGEIGHTVVVPDGPVCGCGQRGCLEALASGTNLARIIRERIKAERPKTKILELAGNDV
ncbi:MAG: ROK family protein, partial [Candidatus Margulisiibacteriota bacterium]